MDGVDEGLPGLRQGGTDGVGVSAGSAQRKSKADQEQSRDGHKCAPPSDADRRATSGSPPGASLGGFHEPESVGGLPSRTVVFAGTR